MVWHLADDVVQIVPGIDIVVSTGCQQRADDGHVPRRFVVPTEDIVLAAQGDGTDFVLGEVVVKQQPSVIEIAHHVVPAGIGVGDGLADL